MTNRVFGVRAAEPLASSRRPECPSRTVATAKIGQHLLVATTLAASFTCHALAQCAGDWIDTTPLAGVNGAVLAAATVDPDGDGPNPQRVYVGGEFSIAGAERCSNLAEFDPVAGLWRAFTPGVTGGQARAISFDGPDRCIVAGSFTRAGDTDAAFIARWDGTAFHPLGPGLNGPVNALARLPDGRLIAAGDFTASGMVPMLHIAAWDGQNWTSLGTGLTYANPQTAASVKSLCILPGGDLIAVGSFDTADGQSALRAARWDGTAWHHLGAGIAGGTNTVVSSCQPLPGGDVVIGGTFATAGGIRALNLARYSPETGQWNSYDLSPANTVNSILATPDGTLYVAFPNFDAQGAVRRGAVLSPDGAWALLPRGFDIPIRCFSLLNAPGGTKLIVGGDTSNVIHECNATVAACNVSGGHIAEKWSTLGSGLATGVESLILLPDGDVICTGAFFSRGPGPSPYGIARYHALTQTWTTLGNGADGLIRAAARVPNTDLIIAGGSFDSIGGTPARNIALWDGSTWRQLGNGLAGDVLTIAVVSRPGGFEAYAGGQLEQPFPNAAMYRSATDTWTPMGPGFDGIIRTMIVHPSHGLVAGGDFLFSGGRRLGGVAQWVGPSAQWIGFDTGLRGQVHALAWAADETLVAGGNFASDERAAPMSNIAMFQGDRWVPLGSGTDAVVRSLAVGFGPGVDIFAGGDFHVCGGTQADHIAHWYDNAWHSFAGGTDAPVRAIATAAPGSVLIGGDFAVAGDRPAGGLAQWQAAPSSLVITARSPGGLVCEGSDISLSISAFGDAALSYQWTRNGMRLYPSDENDYSGETSPTLNLTPAASGTYQCTVSNACAVRTCEPITIEVRSSPACAADFNSDGGIDGGDIEAFLMAWEAGRCDADVNHDGGIDGPDLETFIIDWEAARC